MADEVDTTGEEELTFLERDDPTKWPSNQSKINKWYRKLNAFICELQDFQWYRNRLHGKAKYLNIRIDTRNGNFLIHDDEGNKISPDDLGLKFTEGKEFTYRYSRD
jgi:hypothetical protein